MTAVQAQVSPVITERRNSKIAEICACLPGRRHAAVVAISNLARARLSAERTDAHGDSGHPACAGRAEGVT